MKKIRYRVGWIVGLLALALAAPAAAQRFDNVSLTSATCPGTGCAALNVIGYGGVGIQITGTFVGTLQFEGSMDGGTTYTALLVTPIGSTTAVTSATSGGAWTASAAGLSHVRVRFSAYTSGTAVLSRVVSLARVAPSGGGGGGSGGPCGTDGQVQVNVSGSCAGFGNWDVATSTLTVPVFAASTSYKGPLTGTVLSSYQPAPVITAIDPVLAGAGAGNVDNGTHRYKFTFSDSDGHETQPSAATAAVTVANKASNGQVTVSVPYACDTLMPNIGIYRDFNGDGVFKLVETTQFECALTYTDNTATASLGGVAPTGSTANLPWIFQGEFWTPPSSSDWGGPEITLAANTGIQTPDVVAGSAGSLFLNGGYQASTLHGPGSITLQGGTETVGGALRLYGGSTQTGGTGNGGAIIFTSGYGKGGGNGGDIEFLVADGASAGDYHFRRSDSGDALVIDGNVGTAVFSQNVMLPNVTTVEVGFAALPASPMTGTMASVSDSNTATWGATVAGSGSNHVQVRWNGSNWTVVGK